MQHFYFECYCENAEVLGFPDFKYTMPLGVTRRLVFFEYITAAKETLTPGGDRVPASDQGCRMALPLPAQLRPPRQEPTSVADLTSLPRTSPPFPVSAAEPWGDDTAGEDPPGASAPHRRRWDEEQGQAPSTLLLPTRDLRHGGEQTMPTRWTRCPRSLQPSAPRGHPTAWGPSGTLPREATFANVGGLSRNDLICHTHAACSSGVLLPQN